MLLEQAFIANKEREVGRNKLWCNGCGQDLLAPAGFLSRRSACSLRFLKLVRSDAAKRDCRRDSAASFAGVALENLGSFVLMAFVCPDFVSSCGYCDSSSIGTR